MDGSNSEEKSNYDLLKKNLKKYFNHNHFKSTLQRNAIQTILKRESEHSEFVLFRHFWLGIVT